MDESDDMPPELTKFLISFSRSSAVDQTAAYLRRGRQHADLALDELLKCWVAAYTDMAANITDPRRVEMEVDLRCEIELRDAQVPYDQVLEAAETLNRDLRRRLEDMRLNDPEAWDEGRDAMRADLLRYAQEVDQAN